MVPTSKSVLVTGAAGFIGSRLVQSLLNKGYKVVAFDNLSAGTLTNLKVQSQHSNYTFIKGDIRNRADIQHALKNTHALVHLAAQIDVAASVANPTETHEVNSTGTLNLLEEAVKNHVKQFVFASSTAVYGDTEELPIKENAPLRPLSPYAASKVAGEAYCSAFANCHDLTAIALRFFNVYGVGKENNPYSGVITKFIQKAKQHQPLIIEGDGEQTRDFIHVDDVVEAITLAVEHRGVKFEVFNVCTGKQTSINKLAEVIGKVSGEKCEVMHTSKRVGDIRDSVGDATKAAQGLGFKASIPLEKGLEMQYHFPQNSHF